MSLRTRLTLLYTSLLGGILLLFSVGVFGLVSASLVNHIDDTLTETVREILRVTRVGSVGDINLIAFPPLNMTASVYVQVWDHKGRLRSASPGMTQANQSLDPLGLQASQSVYRNTTYQDVQMRVLSVPLKIGDSPAGVIQAATSMTMVESTRWDLLYVLVATVLLTVLLAALASWLIVGRALAPLGTVTDAAMQINRADDLSRRIPYHGPPEDEIGRLIRAFNHTLGRLEQLFASQQRFLADVSHELRTPLTVIKGNVDLMRRMKSLDEESLTSIDQEANRLTRLVGDLLLLVQAESGNLSLNMKPVELDTLLLEVSHEMRMLAKGKVHIKVTGIDQVQVNGDRDRLKQVLLNLVANAIQYTPRGGRVLLSLGKVGEQARLIVRDTGAGIPAKDLPHIFDRFYRAEKSRTRSGITGFGLGLSIAHWIVEHHGGRIEVDSQEGKGTTFCLWLPLYTAH